MSKKITVLIAILSIMCIIFGLALVGCDKDPKDDDTTDDTTTGDVTIGENEVITELQKKDPATFAKVIALANESKQFEYIENVKSGDSYEKFHAYFNGYNSFKMVMGESTEAIYIINGEDVDAFMSIPGQPYFRKFTGKASDIKTNIDDAFNEFKTKVLAYAAKTWTYDEESGKLKAESGDTVEILDRGFIIDKAGSEEYIKVDNIKNIKITKPSDDKIKEEEVVVKSSEKNLSSLSVEGFEISPAFNKDTLAYTLSVPFGTKQIKINAAAVDTKATIAGIGSLEFTEDSKVFKIKVTAEDTSIKEYTITVTRLEKASFWDGIDKTSAEAPKYVLNLMNDTKNFTYKSTNPINNKDVTAILGDNGNTFRVIDVLGKTDKIYHVDKNGNKSFIISKNVEGTYSKYFVSSATAKEYIDKYVNNIIESNNLLLDGKWSYDAEAKLFACTFDVGLGDVSTAYMKLNESGITGVDDKEENKMYNVGTTKVEIPEAIVVDIPGDTWAGVDIYDPVAIPWDFANTNKGVLIELYNDGTQFGTIGRYLEIISVNGDEFPVYQEYYFVDYTKGEKQNIMYQFDYRTGANRMFVFNFKEGEWYYHNFRENPDAINGVSEINGLINRYLDEFEKLIGKAQMTKEDMSSNFVYNKNGVTLELVANGYNYSNVDSTSANVEAVNVSRLPDLKDCNKGPDLEDIPGSGGNPGGGGIPEIDIQLPDISGEIGKPLQTSAFWEGVDQTNETEIFNYILAEEQKRGNFTFSLNSVSDPTFNMKLQFANKNHEVSREMNTADGSSYSLIQAVDNPEMKSVVYRRYCTGIKKYNLTKEKAIQDIQEEMISELYVFNILQEAPWVYNEELNYFTYEVKGEAKLAMYLTEDGVVVYVANPEVTQKITINKFGTTKIEVPAPEEVEEITLPSEAWDRIDIFDPTEIIEKFAQNSAVKVTSIQEGQSSYYIRHEISEKTSEFSANLIGYEYYFPELNQNGEVVKATIFRYRKALDNGEIIMQEKVEGTESLQWVKYNCVKNQYMIDMCDTYNSGHMGIINQMIETIRMSNLTHNDLTGFIYANNEIRLELKKDSYSFEVIKDAITYEMALTQFPQDPKVDKEVEHPSNNTEDQGGKPGGEDQGGDGTVTDIWHNVPATNPEIISVINDNLNTYSWTAHMFVGENRVTTSIDDMNHFGYYIENAETGVKVEDNNFIWNKDLGQGTMIHIDAAGKETKETVTNREDFDLARNNLIEQVKINLGLNNRGEWKMDKEYDCLFNESKQFRLGIAAHEVKMSAINGKDMGGIYFNVENGKPGPGPDQKPDQNNDMWNGIKPNDPQIVEVILNKLHNDSFIADFNHNEGKEIERYEVRASNYYAITTMKAGITTRKEYIYDIDKNTYTEITTIDKGEPQSVNIEETTFKNTFNDMIDNKIAPIFGGKWEPDSQHKVLINAQSGYTLHVLDNTVNIITNENSSLKMDITFINKEEGQPDFGKDVWDGADTNNPKIKDSVIARMQEFSYVYESRGEDEKGNPIQVIIIMEGPYRLQYKILSGQMEDFYARGDEKSQTGVIFERDSAQNKWVRRDTTFAEIKAVGVDEHNKVINMLQNAKWKNVGKSEFKINPETSVHIGPNYIEIYDNTKNYIKFTFDNPTLVFPDEEDQTSPEIGGMWQGVNTSNPSAVQKRLDEVLNGKAEITAGYKNQKVVFFPNDRVTISDLKGDEVRSLYKEGNTAYETIKNGEPQEIFIDPYNAEVLKLKDEIKSYYHKDFKSMDAKTFVFGNQTMVLNDSGIEITDKDGNLILNLCIA